MPIPSVSSLIPKVKRGNPLMRSSPTHPSRMPTSPIMMAFNTDPCARYVTMIRPVHMRAKYSGGPSLSAAWARGMATSMRPILAIVPAMKDPQAAIPRAGPARPWRAIWCPSKQVMTEDASPGMLTRIEVVEPPY